MIHLDHNATTPVLPEVFEAMRPWFVERFENPSSRGPGGAAAKQAIGRARSQVASLIGASPDEIVFTGGGTEANNLALRGVAARTFAISTIEHAAILEPAAFLERGGCTVHRLPSDPHGRIHGDIPAGTGLASVMLANNETGVLQEVRRFADQVHARGGLMHTDAAQAVGKIAVDVDALGADLLTIAGHKLYGPKGIGALYVRSGVPLQPLVRGASHERGLRPGTENVPAIVGLGEACAIAQRDLDQERARQAQLRDQLWEGLRPLGFVRTGLGPWLPNTLHVRLPGQLGIDLLDRCPALAASTGSACHAGSHHPSPVLTAMGLPADDALGALRLSLGRGTDQATVEAAVQMIGTALA